MILIWVRSILREGSNIAGEAAQQIQRASPRQRVGLVEFPTARNFLTRPPTGRYFSPALPSDCFAIDFPERAISPSEGLPILYTRYLREWPRLPFTARIERAHSYRARSASKKGTWPLPAPPLTALSTGSYNPFILLSVTN